MKEAIKYHLGCGKKTIKGYLNVDNPPSDHLSGSSAADLCADILTMEYDRSSEIRSSHVFEHFGYPESMALLVKWTLSLLPGGILKIGVPDLEALGAALSGASIGKTFRIIRYLHGDQAMPWAYHLNGWTSSSLEFTMTTFGYGNIMVSKHGRPKSERPNCWFGISGENDGTKSQEDLLGCARKILALYANEIETPVKGSEKATLDETCRRMEAIVAGTSNQRPLANRHLVNIRMPN